MTDKPLIIVGAGGHARVVLDAAIEAGYEVIGLVDEDDALHGTEIFGVPVIGDDNVVRNYGIDDVRLIVGIGSTENTRMRQRAFKTFKALGYDFAVIKHPSAHISRNTELGEGVVVMAGAILQAGSRVSDNVIINTGAQLDHDADIGAHTHIAPGAVLSGNVSIGANTHIGCGATIIQGVIIGNGAVVGAGSVVLRNVEDSEMVVGNPATRINR